MLGRKWKSKKIMMEATLKAFQMGSRGHQEMGLKHVCSCCLECKLLFLCPLTAGIWNCGAQRLKKAHQEVNGLLFCGHFPPVYAFFSLLTSVTQLLFLVNIQLSIEAPWNTDSQLS